jgi:signal transduction histidine kinase
VSAPEGDRGVVSATTEVAAWRRRVLQRLLTATAVGAAIAYVPAAWASIRDGVWEILAINTGMWGLIAALALWRSGRYALRAGAYVGLWFVFSMVLVVLLGPVGAGAAWLLAAPLLATVLFGSRGGWWTIAAVATFAFGYVVVLGRAAPLRLAGVPGGGYEATTWAASAGSIVFLAIVLVGAVGALLDGMTAYAERVRSTNQRLAAALADRERLEAALVATEKARALGSLATGIAHDLNNILVPITVAGRAARDDSEDRRQRDRLDLVLEAAERAKVLARRVLAFSHEGAPERHPVALAPLVDDVVGLMRSSAPAGVSVASEVDPDAGEVRADAGEVQQVIMNLCANAVRAVTGSGGTVVVRLRSGASDVVLEVLDDGPGMDPATLARAFEPYFTTHRDGDGTGLGLAIIRHVVESLGGTVALESTLGLGTRAVVRLPAVPGRATSDRPSEVAAA